MIIEASLADILLDNTLLLLSLHFFGRLSFSYEALKAQLRPLAIAHPTIEGSTSEG